MTKKQFLIILLCLVTVLEFAIFNLHIIEIIILFLYKLVIIPRYTFKDETTPLKIGLIFAGIIMYLITLIMLVTLNFSNYDKFRIILIPNALYVMVMVIIFFISDEEKK